MASDMEANGYGGILPFSFSWLKSGKLHATVVEMGRKTKKLGEDDPRRIVHSLKVGLAITLMSLFYYFKPLYDGFGASTMWAILTVILVFEFSVGGTLGRGLNRVMATLVAGALGFGAHYLADLCGEKGQSIVLVFLVFTQAAMVTFVRFFPTMKKRYDYGLLIFMVTFCMVSMSGYRDDEIMKLAYTRALTILIGSFFTVLVCILVQPVWAGSDLHHLVATNIESLGTFFQGFGDEYFRPLQEGESSISNAQIYRSIIGSKSNEESLANLARWEPPHGMFRYGHPWNQYLKIGSLTRECAYRVEVLNGYLTTNHIQMSSQIQDQFQEECLKMSSASGRALRELALAMRKMIPPNISAKTHIEKAKIANEKLKSHLETWRFEGMNVLEIVHVASLTSLLMESISCIEKIADSIQKLASLAHFKMVEVQSSVAPEELEQQDLHNEASSQPTILLAHHVITIHDENTL